ncbi:MAG: periplasmic heavy metal sensor, partial [Thermodesulfobacteriota bacterium]
MLTRSLISILAGLTLILSAAAFAQDVPPGKWWQDSRVTNRLNLSPSEVERLDQAYGESRRRLIQKKSDVEAQQFELESILEKKQFDERAAQQQFQKLESERMDLSKSRFQFLMEVRKILGPERFQNLKNFYEGGAGPPLPARQRNPS